MYVAGEMHGPALWYVRTRFCSVFFWSRAPSFLVSKSWAIRQTVSDCLYTASTDVLRWKPLDIGRDLLLQEIQIELFLYAPRASPKSVHFFNSSEPNKCQHASDSPPSCSCHAESCERPFSTWVWLFFLKHGYCHIETAQSLLLLHV